MLAEASQRAEERLSLHDVQAAAGPPSATELAQASHLARHCSDPSSHHTAAAAAAQATVQHTVDTVGTIPYHAPNSAQVPEVGSLRDHSTGLSMHIDELGSGHVPAEDQGIPNFESADDFHYANNVEAFRPCEYQEPPLLPLPPMGLRIPPTVALVNAVPLCWDWPAIKSTDVHVGGPDHAIAPPRAASGLCASLASFWANPRVAADHAMSASHAARAFMAHLRAQQPLADDALDSEVTPSQRAGTVAAGSSLDVDVRGPDDAPDVGSGDPVLPPAGAGPSCSVPKDAAVAIPVSVRQSASEPEEREAVAAVTSMPPCSEPAVGAVVTASNGMHVVAAARVDDEEGAAQPAQLTAADSPERNDAAPAAGEVRAEEVAMHATAGASGQPDSPGDRNPPHPAERSEDAAIQCGVGAPAPKHRSETLLGVSHWLTGSHCPLNAFGHASSMSPLSWLAGRGSL